MALAYCRTCGRKYNSADLAYSIDIEKDLVNSHIVDPYVFNEETLKAQIRLEELKSLSARCDEYCSVKCMTKKDEEYTCETCGKKYDSHYFHSAIDAEKERIFQVLGSPKLKGGRLAELTQMYVQADRYCCEDCMKVGWAKAKAEIERNKERAKKLDAERAKNRHNPLYIVIKKPIAFLLGILLWGVPMFLLWRSFMPLPAIAIAAVFLSYLFNWSSIYKLFNKFDLEEPILNFGWIFAFMYALGGAVEAVGGIFDIPYAIEGIFESLGRDSAYILMALLVLVITVVNPLLQKSVFKKIPYKIKWKLEPAAMYAISLFSLFHLLNYRIGIPIHISAILAVVGTVAAYKKFEDKGILAIFFANFALSELLFA